jgi:hypothetical protein
MLLQIPSDRRRIGDVWLHRAALQALHTKFKVAYGESGRAAGFSTPSSTVSRYIRGTTIPYIRVKRLVGVFGVAMSDFARWCEAAERDLVAAGAVITSSKDDAPSSVTWEQLVQHMTVTAPEFGVLANPYTIQLHSAVSPDRLLDRDKLGRFQPRER